MKTSQIPIIAAVTGRPPLDGQRNGSNHYLKKLEPYKKKTSVILDHQRPTKKSNYIDELLFPPSTSTQSLNRKPRQQRKINGASYFDIILTSRVYTSLSIFRSHIGGGKHLGSSCDPVTETILLKRNSAQVEKWGKLTAPPIYFERVEADANICGDAYSSSSFRKKAAQLGLFESIQKVILQFDTLKRLSDTCIERTYNINKNANVPEYWWPVGTEGSVYQHKTCMNPRLLRTNSDKNKIMSVVYMAQDVFKLSDSAVLNVLSKKTSLLYEVSVVCSQWHKERSCLPMPHHVPAEYAPVTTLIGPNERFLEVKVGVYYMLERGTVIKFMLKPTHFTDFVLETAIGYSIQDNIKGAIGVIGTCPEAFCIEMNFAGVSLQDVLNGDINCALNHPRALKNEYGIKTVGQQELIQHHMAPARMKGGLYGVRMLQATGRLPLSLQKTCKLPISDSYSAVGVTNIMREKLLDELPFVTAEIVNVVTRLSQQGLVNPDIKSDNIVIDGVTGQPKMIDFGLVIPVGKRDNAREVVSSSSESVYSDYPQTAPEYLMGEKCQEAAMTYGLSYMIHDMLNTLVMRTGNMAAVSMSVNIPLRAFLTKAYAQDFRERPRAYLMAPLIGACFPFRHNIAKLFDEPKHTLVTESRVGPSHETRLFLTK